MWHKAYCVDMLRHFGAESIAAVYAALDDPFDTFCGNLWESEQQECLSVVRTDAFHGTEMLRNAGAWLHMYSGL